MRDPARIKRILSLLERVWHQNPDMRLGQIVTNATSTDPFYLEDDKLEAYLREQSKGSANG
jgi:uncharacterized protein YihD (DUF1040 family)